MPNKFSLNRISSGIQLRRENENYEKLNIYGFGGYLKKTQIQLPIMEV